MRSSLFCHRWQTPGQTKGQNAKLGIFGWVKYKNSPSCSSIFAIWWQFKLSYSWLPFIMGATFFLYVFVRCLQIIDYSVNLGNVCLYMGGSMIGSYGNWWGHLGALIAVLVIWSCLKPCNSKPGRITCKPAATGQFLRALLVCLVVAVGKRATAVWQPKPSLVAYRVILVVYLYELGWAQSFARFTFFN